MPRYHFSVYDGVCLPDHDGTELPDLQAARLAMMSIGGLMVVANFAGFARELDVGDALVISFAALPFALTFDRITNGLTRPFFGWVSEYIGREQTMGDCLRW